MLILLTMPDNAPERDRFTKLYRRYCGLMLYTANRVLHNDADAEDAVQQAFVYIAEHMHKVGAIESPKTRAYAALIAEHSAIDLLRKRKKEDALPFEELEYGAESDFSGGGALTDAMLRLPARDREALLLRDDSGLSLRELAVLYGVSYDSARMLIARARQALQIIMEEEEK